MSGQFTLQIKVAEKKVREEARKIIDGKRFNELYDEYPELYGAAIHKAYLSLDVTREERYELYLATLFSA